MINFEFAVKRLFTLGKLGLLDIFRLFAYLHAVPPFKIRLL